MRIEKSTVIKSDRLLCFSLKIFGNISSLQLFIKEGNADLTTFSRTAQREPLENGK